jgi:FkbM family methyltransferase
MNNKLLKKICGALGYKLIEKSVIKNQRFLSSYSILDVNRILDNLVTNNQIKSIIQIGANDGKSFDELNHFIKKYKIKSLLVEPIKENFEKLKKNYVNMNFITFENSAISIDNEISFLYKVDNKYINDYGSHIPAIPSFNQKHLINHGVKKRHITREKINPISFEALLKKHFITNFDLLFLDAEGYDGKILYNFLEKISIRPIVIFEFIHIEPNFFQKLIGKLKDTKYSFFSIEENMICIPEEKKITLDFN